MVIQLRNGPSHLNDYSSRFSLSKIFDDCNTLHPWNCLPNRHKILSKHCGFSELLPAYLSFDTERCCISRNAIYSAWFGSGCPWAERSIWEWWPTGLCCTWQGCFSQAKESIIGGTGPAGSARRMSWRGHKAAGLRTNEECTTILQSNGNVQLYRQICYWPV